MRGRIGSRKIDMRMIKRMIYRVIRKYSRILFVSIGEGTNMKSEKKRKKKFRLICVSKFQRKI